MAYSIGCGLGCVICLMEEGMIGDSAAYWLRGFGLGLTGFRGRGGC